MPRSAGSSRAISSRTARTSGCATCRSGITCRRPLSAGSPPRASMCRRKTCSPSPGTRGSIQRSRPGAPSGRPATSGTSSAVSMRARIPATERSLSAFRPRSSDSSLFEGRKTMNKRNWKRLLYRTAGVIVAAGVTYACKDFLNIPPQGTVVEQSLETKAGVEGTLVAAYRSLDCSSSSAGSWGCAASNWVWGSVPSGDAHKGSNAGDQQPINDIETFAWAVGEAEGYLNQKWSQAYEGVFRANATLNLLNRVQALKPLEIPTADANSIKGEALFLRAHYHFEAYRLWAHIPYYFETDTTPVAQGGFRKANDLPLDSIAKLIIADLNSAIALLPATPRNGDLGRATSWAAKAYKGRVQVYGASRNPALWDAALTTLRDVQANGPYKLETSFDHTWTGFTQYRNGSETILAFQASIKDGEPSGWNSNWGERLNFPHSGSHFGCCGFHQPSFNLINFFQVDAAGLPLAVTSSAWDSPPLDPVPPSSDTSQVWKGQNFRGGIMRPVDPRVDWTVGRDNVPFKDWGLHNRSWIRDASYSGPYSPKKNIHEQAANGENNRSEEHTSELQSRLHLVCRLLLEK